MTTVPAVHEVAGQSLDATGGGVFVEAYVTPPGERSSKRSSVVQDNNYPVFSNAKFDFEVPDYDVRTAELVFQLKSESRYGESRPIGTATVPLINVQDRALENKAYVIAPSLVSNDLM